MPIQKLTIQDFIQLAQHNPVFDVRSPGEYTHAHIPGAHSLPLFTDAERAVVGTAYKQQSRQQAIKAGLDYFGPKMRTMVEAVEGICNLESGKKGNNNYQTPHPDTKKTSVGKEPVPPSGGGGGLALGVHCWRGGMRSAGVAWLLDLYGFKVYTLVGGYKAYRKWVREQFEKEYQFKIIGGHTGSGKTLVLHQLAQQQQPIIDLEALANHKGSAFGAVGQQPTQEMFENELAKQLTEVSIKMTAGQENVSNNYHLSSNIYLEDESQRIGNLQIPMPLWYTMRKSPVYFLDVPFEERLQYITEEYSKTTKEKLVNAIIRIQKRLGGLETKNAINHLLEDNYKESFRILLRYYDKWYQKGLYNRENAASLLNKIPCSGVDTVANTQKITAWQSATV